MGKLVELSRAKIKEGRREPRSQKELLVYLIYIEMLGHDTSWAQATAIQLCSDKNLAVKKVGTRQRAVTAWRQPLLLLWPSWVGAVAFWRPALALCFVKLLGSSCGCA